MGPSIEAVRRWRRAKQAAVRRYGPGPIADRAAGMAVKRFFKWLAKHRRPAGGSLEPPAGSVTRRSRG
jgi:hypothetical protein